MCSGRIAHHEKGFAVAVRGQDIAPGNKLFHNGTGMLHADVQAFCHPFQGTWMPFNEVADFFRRDLTVAVPARAVAKEGGNNLHPAGQTPGYGLKAFSGQGTHIFFRRRPHHGIELYAFYVFQAAHGLHQGVHIPVAVIEACGEMLAFLNPEYAQVQQREKEMADMRAQISTMAAQMQQLMAQLGSQSPAAEPKGKTKQN